MVIVERSGQRRAAICSLTALAAVVSALTALAAEAAPTAASSVTSPVAAPEPSPIPPPHLFPPSPLTQPSQLTVEELLARVAAECALPSLLPSLAPGQPAPTIGLACAELGLELRTRDNLVHREPAARAFDAACAVRPDQCTYAETLKGTGRAPLASPPAGALAYPFGISARDAARICRAQGGDFESANKGNFFCEGARVAAFGDHPLEIYLDFCGQAALCSLMVHVPLESPDALTALFDTTRRQLVATYGTPTTFEWNNPPECRTSAALWSCIQRETYSYKTLWSWSSRLSLHLRFARISDKLGLLLAYMDAPYLAKTAIQGL